MNESSVSLFSGRDEFETGLFRESGRNLRIINVCESICR